MAYKTILTKDVYSWEQEELTETKLVANPDTGEVSEITEILQEYAKVRGELAIQQEIVNNEGSRFYAELRLYITAGENGDGFSIKINQGVSGASLSSSGTYLALGKNASNYIALHGDYQPKVYVSAYAIQPGETRMIVASKFDSYNNGYSRLFASSYSGLTNLTIGYHNLDGSFNGFQFTPWASKPTKKELEFCGNINLQLSNLIQSDTTSKYKTLSGSFYHDAMDDALVMDRAVIPITAVNFTDEENPSFTYSAINGYIADYHLDNSGYYSLRDEIIGLQAALSFDGITADIPFRDIAVDATSYVFDLTQEESEILRVKAQGSPNVPIYYLTKVIRETGYTNRYGEVMVETQRMEFINATERVLTIVGCMPTLNPTVIDVNSDTIALTGNPNIFVRYESQVEFSTGATASKHATIVSQSVQCGSKTVSNLYHGVISDIETGSFIFNATDSRGLHANQVVISNTGMIEYIKPTISQEVEIELSGETGAIITVSVRGNYYNGTFGAVDNTLALYVRYASGKNELGDWVKLEGTPTLNGNTYELTTEFSGLDYDSSYTFQCRAVDKLNTVETQSYTIKLLPVFDWSETDFNFNVPVNIDADNLSMHNNTIIRHSNTTNNTVLSANGGHIYLRPGGTSNTAGETIFYPDGSVKFGGSVDLSKSLVDYIVEAGETEMGSNGTWYWRKWASGKAECYGCRNFGNMAVNTAWGNLYRSDILTQSLPNGVFKRTPDVININIVSANFGGWICKHENTAPSAATTGSFIFVRPASATVSPTYIGFYIIGDWQ